MRKNHNKIVASSWYIFLTYIYDARSHLYQIFTTYEPRHRSDVTRSMYVQISRGHSISTNPAVNSQSVILVVLISIDVQTEISFLINKCRYSAW